MRIHAFVGLMLLACSAHAAQMYRWVDENGVVTYSQTPPPPNARDISQKNTGTNNTSTESLPYSLQQAIKNFPLTFYATPDCGNSSACADARAYLQKRGAPYTERNPLAPDELENFKKLSPNMRVPVLTVGTFQTLTGFSDANWGPALDAAGYPRAPLPGVKLPPDKTPDAATTTPAPVRDDTHASPPPAPNAGTP